MTKVDDIFLGSGGLSPGEVLDEYGPQINEWPTGHKTISFGELNKNDPAAAYCIGAIGGLALQAEGGVDAGAAELSSAISTGAAGVILQSTTMMDALDNIRRGGGLKTTLAIAVNLNDPNAKTSLKGALLSPLSAGGVAAAEGASGTSRTKTTKKAAKSASELGTLDGSDIIALSKSALVDYVQSHFKKDIRPDDPMLLAHAYTALLRRTSPPAGSVASTVWRGGLVEVAGRYSSDVLESKLSEACLEELEISQQQGIRGRGGIPVGSAGGISLPVKKRSSSEAVRYKVYEGMQNTARSRSDVAEDSYTGERVLALDGNLQITYTRLLQDGIRKYMDCVDHHEGVRQQRRATRDSVRRRLYARSNPEQDTEEDGPSHRGLLDDRPHLDPRRLAHANNSNLRLIEHIRESAPGTALERLRQGLFMPPRGNMNPEDYAIVLSGWRSEVAAVMAAISLEHGDANQKDVKSILGSFKHIQAQVSAYVRDNIGLFTERGLAQLDASLLSRYGLNRNDVNEYQNLPPEAGATELASIDSPPLPLCVLVADILNFNNRSVLPVGTIKGRLPSRQNETEDIADAVRDYVVERFHITGKPPSRKMVGLLLECDIADRMGFFTDSALSQEGARMAQRIRDVAGSFINPVQKRNFPEAVMRSLQRCDDIIGPAKPPKN